MCRVKLEGKSIIKIRACEVRVERKPNFGNALTHNKLSVR
jgi:hypothetical protein